VIVPQGVLGLVPFAALPLAKDVTLGERFALRFAPSIAAIGEVSAAPSNRDDVAWRQRALIVGNPEMPTTISGFSQTVTLPPLLAAEQEARTIAAELGVRPLTGKAASEQTVVTRLPDATIVHLATHGYAFSAPEMARRSFVALAPAPGYDGVLTVGQLLDEVPRLSAELIVLSACETGLGDVTEAEGTIGLQRALLAKGARSVIVTLWDVDDEATSRVMTSFYRHWLHDPSRPDKATALQLAIGDLRRDGRFRDPRYWAAFQLIGNR